MWLKEGDWEKGDKNIQEPGKTPARKGTKNLGLEDREEEKRYKYGGH